MTITVASKLFIRKSVSEGHGGTRTNYYAVIEADGLTIYPVKGAGYGSPLIGSLSAVKTWAEKVGNALGIEVVDETEVTS